MFLGLSSDFRLQWTTPVIVSQMRYVLRNGTGYILRMHVRSSCERHSSSHYTVSNISSKPLPAIMAPIEPINESKWWNPPSRTTAPENDYVCPRSQDHFSCIRIERLVEGDSDARLSTFATLFRHILNSCFDMLLGSIFTIGSGRTADVHFSVLPLRIFLIYPLQPGRGRICDHVSLVHSASCRRDVPTLSDSMDSVRMLYGVHLHSRWLYNNDVFGIVDACIKGKYQSCMTSFANTKSFVSEFTRQIWFN